MAKSSFISAGAAAIMLNACAQAGGAVSAAPAGQGAPCSAEGARVIAMEATPALHLKARVDAENCREGAVVVTMREPDGTLSFADGFPLKALALIDPPSPDAAADLITAFEDNIVLRKAGDMPPYASATGVSEDNPTPISIVATRRVYERARRIGGRLVCFPVHYETSSCVWRDPEHGGVFHLYYSGG